MRERLSLSVVSAVTLLALVSCGLDRAGPTATAHVSAGSVSSAAETLPAGEATVPDSSVSSAAGSSSAPETVPDGMTAATVAELAALDSAAYDGKTRYFATGYIAAVNNADYGDIALAETRGAGNDGIELYGLTATEKGLTQQADGSYAFANDKSFGQLGRSVGDRSRVVLAAVTVTANGKTYRDLVGYFFDRAPSATNDVAFDRKSIWLSFGEERLLTATVMTLPEVSAELAWSSSDPETVSVTAAGLARGLREGTATLTATLAADATVFDTCFVQVHPEGYQPGWPTIAAQAGDYYSGIDFSAAPEVLHDRLDALVNAHAEVISYSYLKTVLADAERDPDRPGNVLLFYTGESRKYAASDDMNAVKVNREHVWPQSRGTASESTQAHSEPHMLHLSDATTNCSRGNKVYGNPGEADTYYVDNDEFKGQAARSVLFMELRYGNSMGLVLDENTANLGKNMGKASVMLSWDVANEPLAFERRRLDTIQTYEGNRNPFIDIPGLSLYLYGSLNAATRSVYEADYEAFGLPAPSWR